VRNLDSGEVEVWAEGADEALDSYLDWLREGPPGAVVSSVRTARREIAGYASFDVEI